MRFGYLIAAVALAMIGTYIVLDGASYSIHWTLPLHVNRDALESIADFLRMYDKSSGRYPSNDEGLLAVRPLVEQVKSGARDPDLPYRGLLRCRIAPEGILSLWGEPFIYENRRGLAKARFADSGATRDTARSYSVRVDQGIYVWSIGAERMYRHYVANRRTLKITGIVFALAAAVCLALYVRQSVRRPSVRWSATTRFIWSLLSGFAAMLLAFAILFPGAMRSCYDIAIGRPRTPSLTRDYLALITKYHERGVIGDAAYEKIKKAMKKEQH